MLNKDDWKKIGIFGIIAYLFSIPIMVWKSSRVGKILMVVMIISVSIWGLGKASDLYFLKFRYRMVVDEKMKPLKEHIESLKEQLAQTKNKITVLNSDIENKMNENIDLVTNQAKSKIEPLSKKIEEIETAVDLIREAERQSVKDKIIDLKEQVKIHKKSIDSAEIRKQCELIADKMYLLKDDEKKRFYDDLEAIGFGVKKAEEKMTQIYTNNWVVTSSDVVSYSRGNRSRGGNHFSVTADSSVYFIE